MQQSTSPSQKGRSSYSHRQFSASSSSVRRPLSTALGRILIVTGVPEEAEAPLHTALAYRRANLPADHPKVGEARCVLGRALAAQGRYEEAEPLLREGFPAFAAWGLAHPNLIDQTRRVLAETYTALGEPEKAAPYQAP
jgi:tetratricopeptide (TPR) repeat protein